MSVAILGAGAFGTALAVSLAQNGPVTLWMRSAAQAEAMRQSRENTQHLPGIALPEAITITAEMAAVAGHDVVLLAVPMQQMAGFLASHGAALNGKTLVSCSKGIDLTSGRGAVALIGAACPASPAAVLTGPSFAADIARGLPTALTLAMAQDPVALQARLSTPTLRLYRSTDTIGAELGGALKNVIAIAAGVVTGAGLGDSARAALMTRGFAEMNRLALHFGARPETLSGLSGLGDLVLTCTSAQSRNFRFGHALGSNTAPDGAMTVEGAATAVAASALAEKTGIDMPVTAMIAALCARRITVSQAIGSLLSRPLKEE